MTMTQTPPATSVITEDIRLRVNGIADYMNLHIKERGDIVRAICVARVAQLHALMIGPGGTGKSYLQRSLVRHIVGAKHFEVAFDETTDPAQVLGPVDIKAMAEDGKTRRNFEGMLPDATDAFLDEFYNGNTPLLHSIMPLLNERIFHNNGMPMETGLRQCVMGTNKLNLDADLAALGDRVHLKFKVDYIQGRQNRQDMIMEAIARMAAAGKRGTVGLVDDNFPTVTLEELDQAFNECLQLAVPDAVFDLFLDVREEITHKGIVLSDRRDTEVWAAIMANAWFRGHEEVQPVDLDILSHMWWTNLEEQPVARAVVLEASNPGEKAAMDLEDALDELRVEYRKIVKNTDLDTTQKRNQSLEAVKNIEKVIREAEENHNKAVASGLSTTRIDGVKAKALEFKTSVAQDIFGVTV